MKVIKRDGRKEPFQVKKIIRAVQNAYDACDTNMSSEVREALETLFTEGKDLSIEEIQDKVEEVLMQENTELAKSFIIYRYKHKRVRDFVRRKIEFIENYKKSSNTANATIDDNSNVSSKNIGILNAEIHKEDNINISRGMVMAKLRELYPDFNAKQYIKDLENHIIYKHDESSFAGAVSPYTYSPKEVVEVKYGKNHWMVALDTLYDLIDYSEELLDAENEVYAKFPEGLFIKDNNNWTNVTRVIKKRRHRDLVRVKTSFGEDLVVTDNHPLIISDNINETVEAKDSYGHKQLRVNPNLIFDGNTLIDLSLIVPYTIKYKNYILQQTGSNAPYYSCKRYLNMDRKFGYFVGFFIGDGHYDNTKECISFTQKDKETLNYLAELIYTIAGVSSIIEYKRDKTNCWRMYTNSKALFFLFKYYFKIKDFAQNKNLPINLLEFNPNFAKGIIEGLIDSDGTVQNNGSGISIRLSSREGINQLTTLLRYFRFGVANTTQSSIFSNNTGYKTNYTIWGVSFNNTVGAEKLDFSSKWRSSINRELNNHIKYKEGWVNIDSVTKIENTSFLNQCDYIYDITTDSHTFLSNNLLVHNCCSITMYPFLTDGIKGIGGLSAKPKNLDSFCGMYVNLIFAVASQFAGAVATSEFLLYFDYFCKKEWGEDYWKFPDRKIKTWSGSEHYTVLDEIQQKWQQVIYSINQPAASRGMQSASI